MWPDRRLMELVGLELPFVQAPMAGAMDWELAAAAAHAGAKIRSRTRKPLNLNFFCHRPPVLNNEREARWRESLAPFYRELAIDPAAAIPSSNRAAFDATFCDAVEELQPAVVSFHFGLPEPQLVKRMLRKYGYPPDLQDAAVQNVLQQAEALSAEWAA